MTLERISRRFMERHPDDAVRIVEQLADEDKSTLIQSLEPDTAAGILQAMTPADAVSCITLMMPAQSIPVLKCLSPNFAAGCLRRLAADRRREILAQAGRSNDLKNVRTLLTFPPDVAGAVMDTETAAVQEQMSSAEAVAFAKRHPDKLRNIIYVVNGENILVGLIEARDLLILKDKTPINSVMKPIQYRLNGRAYLHAARDNPGWEHCDDLPVVDYHGTYLGSLNRESFLHALAEIEVDSSHGDQPKEILLGLAETFLNTCSEFLFPHSK
jgi:Mg/Co/Ni transporter MgtE